MSQLSIPIINKRKILLLITLIINSTYGNISSANQNSDNIKSVSAKIAVNDVIDIKPNVSDELIIKYANQSTENALLSNPRSTQSINMINRLSSRSGVQLKHERMLASGAQLVKIKNLARGISSKEIAQRISEDPNVLYVEPNAWMVPFLTPNDTRYNDQWHYKNTSIGMNAETAWDTDTGSGVVVAVLDTGIVNHQDLNANVLNSGYDFISSASTARDGNGRDNNPQDEGDWWRNYECSNTVRDRNSSWHGSHVAGTIAAVTNNNRGVAGVAFNAKILPVRVLGKCGGTLADIADAIIWAAGGSVSGVPNNNNAAQVINMSLGGGGACGSTYQSAINTARNLGATIVVSSGNSNANTSGFRPGNCNGVITVAATDQTGGRASYSNYGAGIEIAAPGGVGSEGVASNRVLSTINNGDTTPVASPSGDVYAFYAGTSMAAPHVSGVAALLYGKKNDITPDEVTSAITSTADALAGSCSGGCGSGLVNAKAALDSLDGTPPDPDPELQNGVGITISGADNSETRFTFEVPSNATSLTFTMSGGSGDADLYVRYGTPPQVSPNGSWDCRPWIAQNNETCEITNIQAGTYHVMVHGYDAYSNANLVSEYETGQTPTTVFEDDFETNLGWTSNPAGTDTATTGQWERANPQATNHNGAKQLGTTVSGSFDLVTAGAAGSSVGSNDIDGGVTSIRSPSITLPGSGTLTLSFSYYMAHTNNSSSADFFRVTVVGNNNSVVLEEQGATNDDDAVWQSFSANISTFAGQTIYLLIEAADNAGGSIVEAAVDDVKIISN